MRLVPFYHKIEEICCEGKAMGFPFLSAATSPPPPQAATSVSILYTTEVIKTHYTVLLVQAGEGGWAQNLSHVFL
jgi:hypothetical protein